MIVDRKARKDVFVYMAVWESRTVVISCLMVVAKPYCVSHWFGSIEVVPGKH